MTLECTEARKLGLTPSRYTTQKVSGALCGRSLPRQPGGSAGCAAAEQAHDDGQDGAQKVQSLPTAAYGAPRDQVGWAWMQPGSSRLSVGARGGHWQVALAFSLTELRRCTCSMHSFSLKCNTDGTHTKAPEWPASS